MTVPLTLQSLPLFPLGTVLFPGGVLPLRVFEVRYLDMIRRCLKAGAPFGVVALTQGHEVRQAGSAPESIASVGTLAQIASAETPQPGLMLVRVAGGQRFRIQRSEQLKHGLWVADVELLPADASVAVPQDLQNAAQALAHLFKKLESAEAASTALSTAPPQWSDCGWLANRWCELLPLPVAIKQQLLELDNPLLRLELVGDVLTQSGISA
ncbi:LON peptidase substrate-binding domain-containing protein [Acidovorax lacteus]|uniref:LON peptidase substrate-binding domain-containing protein n=1 Tax=Acidovorax lacteus TaxID=1924988 RepID=UPI0031E71202